MPSKDRTFSEKDVIRIANRNLTREERREVVLTLCRGFKEDQEADALPSPEEEAIESFPLIDLVSDIFALLTGEVLILFGEELGTLLVNQLDSLESRALDAAQKRVKK